MLLVGAKIERREFLPSRTPIHGKFAYRSPFTIHVYYTGYHTPDHPLFRTYTHPPAGCALQLLARFRTHTGLKVLSNATTTTKSENKLKIPLGKRTDQIEKKQPLDSAISATAEELSKRVEEYTKSWVSGIKKPPE